MTETRTARTITEADHQTEDEARETNWDRPCPHCKAQPGQPCRMPNGSKFTTYLGTPRFHAKRRLQPAGGHDGGAS